MFLKILIIITAILFFILLTIYIFASILLNKFFVRMDFEKGNGLISYDDIKDKYERKVYEFRSKRNTLKAFLYRGRDDCPLIVYVHGMCPGHQGYMSDITSLIDRGYNIFTYDFSATGESTGKTYSGLDQQVYDLKSAMSYLKENNYFGFNSVHLYGHSMGAYAVAVSEDDIISSKVCISGFDNQIDTLLSYFTKDKSKLFKGFSSFMIRFKYFIDRGINYNPKASNILKNTSTPTLIIHGSADEIISFENDSINSKKDLIKNELVEYITIDDPLHNLHNSIIASTECVLYQNEIQKIYDEAIKEGHNNQEARNIMLKSIDVFKYNVANEELMDEIDKFYKKHNK